MKLLLDTHMLIWTLEGSSRLSEQAIVLIDDHRNQIFYSVASLWEVQIKHSAHPEKMIIDANEFGGYCKKAGFECLPIAERHVLLLDSLNRSEDGPKHQDPFDRILICQAKADGLTLLTHDALLSGYGEPCVLLV